MTNPAANVALGVSTPPHSQLHLGRAADGVVYVSTAGSDTESGNTWGTAKATIAAAITALPTVSGKKRGVVHVGAGTFDQAGVALTVDQFVSLVGQGTGVTIITSTGATGDVVRWTCSAFTVDQAGALKGLTIDGTGAGAGAAGLHMGDIVGAALDDMAIVNFTGVGSCGLWCDNVTSWTERTTATRLRLENNTISHRFTVNGGNASFGYNRWLDVRYTVNSGQVGVSVEGTSYVYSNTFTATMNVAGPSGNTAVGIDVKNTAYLYQASFEPFAMEQSSGTGATSVRVAVGATFGYHGLLITNAMPFAGTASRFYYHDGTAPGAVTIGVPGATALTIDGTQGRLFQVGPMAGNVTSTSFINLLQGVVYTLVFVQDGTGGRTISLPGTLKWAGGAAPTWSTTANYRDSVRFYFDGASLFEVSRSIGVR